MINGFVGFQLFEDGTTLSVWLLRICSLTMFVISFAIALLTFKGWAGLGPENTIGLFVVTYLFSAIFLFVYVVMQILLVIGTLQERWPLWHIGFGVFGFSIGQVILYVFSDTICDNVQHYMDGLFFATLCNLLGVMMVYKVCTRVKRLLDGRTLTGYYSTGTRSRRKTWNSQSAKSRTTGKSRSCYRRTTAAQYTRTANLQAACTISLAREDLFTAIEWFDVRRKLGVYVFGYLFTFSGLHRETGKALFKRAGSALAYHLMNALCAS